MDTVRKPTKSKRDPWTGKIIIEKYQLETLIGSGGMGSVYIGKHLQLGRTVAVKVMNADIASDKTASARFIREAKASAKLDHPNTVTIHDFGMIDDNAGAFIVMEYISGQTLRKYLAKHGPLPLEKALEWFMPICDVIETAHQRGIIHRDLKPENIMLKTVGEEVVVKVVDFGLAKITTDSGVSISQKLTQTGEFMGTPQYMAPEVYDGEAADSRADIYALGIILYEMITGKVPFSGSVQNIISGHLFKEPQPLVEINPNLPTELDQVLKLALEKKRENRINSALEFAKAFKLIVDPNNKITDSFSNSNSSDSLSYSKDKTDKNNKAINTGITFVEDTVKPNANATTLVELSADLPTLQDSLPKTTKVELENIPNILQANNESLPNKTDINIGNSPLSLLKEKPWMVFVGIGIVFVILVIAIYGFKLISQENSSSPTPTPTNNTQQVDSPTKPTSKPNSSKILSETEPRTGKELRKDLQKKSDK